MTNRTKAILGLSGVFLLGLICGALALGLVVRDRVQERSRLKNALGFRDYFVDELSLTEGQKDSLQAELERAYREMADIRDQVEIEYREVFDTLAQRMEPILTASQRTALAQQKERLLPKRPATEIVTSNPPSIQEIDRRVASSKTSSSPNTLQPNGGKRDSTTADAKEQPAVADAPDHDAVPYDDDASAGDSILTPETREENLPRIIRHMKKKLTLTDDQSTKIEDLLRKALRRNRWIRENFKDEPLVRGRRLRQSFRLLERQVAEQLTEEQLKVYDGMKKKLRKGK